MKHARLSDLKEIYGHFQRRKDVFPHVRQDKLQRMIEKRQVVWQDGVIVTYQQYKKRTRVGDIDIPAGSIMLHQILNTQQFSGAGGRVFERFAEEIVKPSGCDLYLSVRKQNAVACSFYERHGMAVVGRVSWSCGTLPGLVYRRTAN
jgi:FR47-like protein